MNVAELRKSLDKFKDDAYVFITIEGSRFYAFIDKIDTTGKGEPILTSIEAPTFDDLEGLADACWDEHYKSLSELEKQAIREFSDHAREAMKAWREGEKS